jgi:hypothetical protein
MTISRLNQDVVYLPGQNAIINGDFGIWQRGTSLSASGNGYLADRWIYVFNGTGTTRSVTRETFNPGDLVASGYGSGEFFFRFDQSVAGSGGTFSALSQRIENVETFSNQTVTLSFWAKSSSTSTVGISIQQNFGSGGSTTVITSSSSVNLTNSWVRYTRTITLPSISGKTVGTSSYLNVVFGLPLNSVFTVDLWGVQLEAGPVATLFKLAGGGSKGAELALCYRYFIRYSRSDTTNGIDVSSCNPVIQAYSSSAAFGNLFYFPARMRANPTATLSAAGDVKAYNAAGSSTAVFTAVSFNQGPTWVTIADATGASGMSTGQATSLIFEPSFNLNMSAEL